MKFIASNVGNINQEKWEAPNAAMIDACGRFWLRHQSSWLHDLEKVDACTLSAACQDEKDLLTKQMLIPLFRP